MSKFLTHCETGREMKKNNLLRVNVLAKLLVSFVILSYTSVPLAALKNSFVNEDQGDLCLNLENIAKMQKWKVKHFFTEILPANLDVTTSESHFARQVLDHNLKSLIGSYDFNQKNLIMPVKAISFNMTPLGGSAKNNSVNHSFKFSMEALHAKTSFIYEGYFQAKASLALASNNVNLEVSKKLNSKAELSLSLSDSQIETTERLSVRWVF